MEVTIGEPSVARVKTNRYAWWKIWDRICLIDYTMVVLESFVNIFGEFNSSGTWRPISQKVDIVACLKTIVDKFESSECGQGASKRVTGHNNAVFIRFRIPKRKSNLGPKSVYLQCVWAGLWRTMKMIYLL